MATVSSSQVLVLNGSGVSRSKGGIGGQHAVRLPQVRHIQHLAVEADGAETGTGREGRHHPASEGNLLGGGTEALVDRADLGGVDGDLTGEAFPPGGGAGGAQRGLVAEVGLERV